MGKDVKGFVGMRLRTLKSPTLNRILELGHPIDFRDLATGHNIVQLGGFGADSGKILAKPLITQLLLQRIYHEREVAYSRGEELPHINIVLEEFASLFSGATNRGVTGQFTTLLDRCRAFGMRVIMPDQQAGRIRDAVPSSMTNSLVRFMLRQPDEADRAILGASMGMTPEQMRQAISLKPGQAFVTGHTDQMMAPVLVQMDRFRKGEADPTRVQPVKIRGRVSAACGSSCTHCQACSLGQLKHADDLANGQGADALLRQFGTVLVQAYMIGGDLPIAPQHLRDRYANLGRAVGQCVTRGIVERSIDRRRNAIPGDTSLLKAQVAYVMDRLLTADTDIGSRAGSHAVNEQVQWLRAKSEVNPHPTLGVSVGPDDLAPPIERWPEDVKERFERDHPGHSGPVRIEEYQRYLDQSDHATVLKDSGRAHANRRLAVTAIGGMGSGLGQGELLDLYAAGRHVGADGQKGGELIAALEETYRIGLPGTAGWLAILHHIIERFVTSPDRQTVA